MLKQYRNDIIISIIALAIAFFIGRLEGLISACILAVLEVSLSFDNCIVNSKVLEQMDAKWQHRFLTWGMLIAVFGMRLIFPILIVSATAEINPYSSVMLAITNPDQYSHYLTTAHTMLMAFGGLFLFRVAAEFFCKHEEGRPTWLPFELLTKHITKKWLFRSSWILVLIGIAYYTKFGDKGDEIFVGVSPKGMEFLYGSVAGIILFDVIEKISSLLQGKGDKAVKSGLALFIYLEVLDSSFSFDGVIGAFAISNEIFIIAIGLGIGALFVRSMTIDLVERKIVRSFRYLEHGAFYSILALSIIMLIKTDIEVPELITGGISMVFIIASLVHSIIYKRIHHG